MRGCFSGKKPVRHRGRHIPGEEGKAGRGIEAVQTREEAGLECYKTPGPRFGERFGTETEGLATGYCRAQAGTGLLRGKNTQEV